MGGIFKFLGKVWKGKATVVGVIVAALGALGQSAIGESVIGVSDSVTTIVIAVGSILAAFGIGRKAGYKVNE